MSEITFEILNIAVLATSRGVDTCSMIELHPSDFGMALDVLKKALVCIDVIRRDNITNLLDAAMKEGKFVFRDAIVIPNVEIEQGHLKTFNKRNLESRYRSFDEINRKEIS